MVVDIKIMILDYNTRTQSQWTSRALLSPPSNRSFPSTTVCWKTSRSGLPLKKKSIWFPFISSFSIDRWLVPPKPQKIVKACQVARIALLFPHKNSPANCLFSIILKLKISRTSVPPSPASSRSRTCGTTRSSSASTSSSPSSTSASSPGGQSLKSIFYETISKQKNQIKKSSQLWFFLQPSCRVPPLLEHRQLAQLVDHVSARCRLGVHYY